MDGYGVTISDIIEEDKIDVVFNLDEVDGNNNFFVEDLLAHNRAGYYSYYSDPTCFSANVDITMSDGSVKKINEIEVGDMIKGNILPHMNVDYTKINWDGVTPEVGSKVIAFDHRHTVGSHSDACES